MNLKIVNNAIGRLLQVLGLLMVVPLLVAFIYHETLNDKLNFIIPILVAGILGTIMVKTGSEKGHIYTREAMFTTAFCWLLYSAIGAIPLLLTPTNYPTFIDAFFEMASGFTTCGASVAQDVEILPHSIIFWRSFSHLIGGMGILVFTLAILPKVNKESTNLMQAEVPGPTFGKITPKLSHTARVLYIIYLVMTAITAIFLLFGGMNLFDSLIFAFGTAGTGGFANRGISVGYYNSRYIEIVLGVAMFLFGVNFNLYYYAIFRSVKDSFKSEELKWYAIIVALSTILIFINISGMYDDKFYAGVNSFFTVTSIITTTGYVSAHYGKWPMFSRNILILLMFIGGSAGSTAGGLKVSRITMLCKSAINQVKQTINPMRVTVNKLDGKKVDDEVENSVNKYLLVYLLIFIIFMLIVTLETNDLETSFTAVATTFNNVGPGLGEFGPINSFTNLGYLSKFTLTLAMLFGRLELYPMILLFSPATYKNIKNK
ncbi:Trk system potassium uptake protein trkG [Anaerococcus octavius]|uniref:Trk system potassium uptake protein trkG n=1 Tax=Anaerococcus octavius TaxID=54007 RepID=A0A380WV45_9FIRM|nr:TrkH family potassium uptake protein [Anaerococcus octavius]SUU92888.1 Trk system potassium uptake protein trkG [Anaerococcus octavius]